MHEKDGKGIQVIEYPQFESPCQITHHFARKNNPPVRDSAATHLTLSLIYNLAWTFIFSHYS